MKYTWGSNVDEKNLRGYKKCLKSDSSSTYAFYRDLKSVLIKVFFAEDRIVKKKQMACDKDGQLIVESKLTFSFVEGGLMGATILGGGGLLWAQRNFHTYHYGLKVRRVKNTMVYIFWYNIDSKW